MDNTVQNPYVMRNEENAVWTKLDETVMIITSQENEEKVFKLNKTAAFLWEQCDGSKTMPDLVQAVCTKFDVDKLQAQEDTLTFINSLKNKHLLSLSSRAA